MDPRRVLIGAARWFGAGLVAAPMLELANDHGLLQALGTLDFGLLTEVAWIGWAQLAFFAVVGVAAAWLMARLRRGMRGILFWGCSIPLALYAVAGGLRLPVVAGALVLCFAYVQLRSAPEMS